MASTLVFPPSYRVLDTDGNPVSGAQIQFFEAGTSTPKVVYSDDDLSSSLGSVVYTRSDGYPVASEGSNTTVLVYTGEDSYKITILRSDDTQIFSADNVIGAPTFVVDSDVTFIVPVVTTGSPVTLAESDRGKLYNAQTTTITFPAAATLGDNWYVHIRNGGSTTGRVVLSAASGIAYQGTSYTTMYLEPGQAISVACDGTAYRAFGDAVLYTPAGFRPNTPGIIMIEDRITAEPSTSVGSRYIVSSSYDSFSTHDIVWEVASGTFLRFTPTTDCGWVAYVKDENMFYVFVASAWVPFFSLINELTEDTTPDETADYVPTWDASASLPKKVKPQNLTQAGGVQLLNSGTVTNAATLDIVLTSFTAYRGFVITLAAFVPATDDVELWMRFSTDGGSNYDATGYAHILNGIMSNGDALTNSSDSANQIVIAGDTTATESVSNVSGEGGADAVVTLLDPATARYSRATFEVSWLAADTTFGAGSGGGIRKTAQNTDAVRFLFESGNIASGGWALYGLI